jgi:hypothetical protein
MVLAQQQRGSQCTRTEQPDINLHSYSLLIFDKGVQNTKWRKDSLFKKCCWEILQGILNTDNESKQNHERAGNTKPHEMKRQESKE